MKLRCLVAALVVSAPVWPVGRANSAPSPLAVDGHPSRGRPDALVTIVAFLDFTSEPSRKIYATLLALLARHPRELRLVVRILPTGLHRFSAIAARIAVEAHRQGKFWAFCDQLMRAPWPLKPKALTRAITSAGLDKAKLKAAILAGPLPDLVDVYRAAKALRLRGVPTLFVNGVRLDSPRPEQVRKAYARALAEARELVASGRVTRKGLYRYILAQRAAISVFLEGLARVRPRPGLTLAGRPTLGRPTAPVQMVWFTNPYCISAWTTFRQLSEYVPWIHDGVQVTVKFLVKRPLDIYGRAALLGIHAHMQGRFWSFLRRLSHRRPTSLNGLLEAARQAGVRDPERAFTSPQPRDVLLRDVREAAAIPGLGPQGMRCNALLLLPDALATGWSATRLLHTDLVEARRLERSPFLTHPR